MTTDYLFGEWVKARRKYLRLTQRALAEKASCALVTVKKIEANQRRPAPELAGLLAAGLNMPPRMQPIFVECARGERPVSALRDPAEPILLGWPCPRPRLTAGDSLDPLSTVGTPTYLPGHFLFGSQRLAAPRTLQAQHRPRSLSLPQRDPTVTAAPDALATPDRRLPCLPFSSTLYHSGAMDETRLHA